MTKAEVAIILRLFETNWPNLFDATRATVALWASEVADIDAEVGARAADRIIKADERPPTIARFLAECQNVKRSRALSTPKPDPERLRRTDYLAGVAAARAALEAAHPWTPPIEPVATVHPLRSSGTDVEL